MFKNKLTSVLISHSYCKVVIVGTASSTLPQITRFPRNLQCHSDSNIISQGNQICKISHPFKNTIQFKQINATLKISNLSALKATTIQKGCTTFLNSFTFSAHDVSDSFLIFLGGEGILGAWDERRELKEQEAPEKKCNVSADSKSNIL